MTKNADRDQKCRICNSDSVLLFTREIMFKYNINYFRCTTCNFIQTEEPYWLEEAYSDAIAETDIGLMFRNLEMRPKAYNVIRSVCNTSGRFLDYGGGLGVFVRMMRDLGLDFYRHDKYCDNLFCKGFDCEDLLGQHFELITAFEVLEHMLHPEQEIRALFNITDTILFTTELQPGSWEKLKKWWYFAPNTGQHISLFSLKSLRKLAELQNVHLITNGLDFHILSKKKISPVKVKLLSNRISSKFLFEFQRMWNNSSLLQLDHEVLVRQQM